METYIDVSIVFLYLTIILLSGYAISRKHKKGSAKEFMTGGKTMNWFQTGLTLIAMSIDTGIMGVAGLGFVWGMTIQPNAANLWFTAPLAAMFLIPIYWRTKILTTPELLEKRFNVAARAFFSGVMALYSIIILGTSIYLGALILMEIFGLQLWIGCFAIMLVVGIYVMLGGMKTVLVINQYQAVFIVLTLFVVAFVTVNKIGGINAFAAIEEVNEGGQILPSTLLPFDWSLNAKEWYHFPPGLLWAGLAGAAWIACNFGMAQRLLAAKNEQHAQKAILFTGFGHVVTFLMAYAIGVSIKVYAPEIEKPDTSYVKAIFDFFPVGVRGILIAGLIASLLSTIDGLLTSASTLITNDVYLRFVRPKATDKDTKLFVRIVQAIAIVCAILLIPVAAKAKFITDFIQSLVADLFGVVIAIYLVGIFSTRATSRAALISMFGGLLLAIFFDFATDMSFVYVGIFSFTFTYLGTVILSRFEKPIPSEQLKNLTIWTLEDTKGPFVGLKAWPALWKWIALIGLAWGACTAIWEYWIRSL